MLQQVQTFGSAARRFFNEILHLDLLGAAGRAAILIVLIAGCATNDPSVEHGKDGTIAYYVKVESSESGARIEVNNEFVGKTPMTLKIWGDCDGTFHNFGSDRYTVRAYPVKPGQQMQTKEFRTGGWFGPEDKVPAALYFDFGPGP